MKAPASPLNARPFAEFRPTHSPHRFTPTVTARQQALEELQDTEHVPDELIVCFDKTSAGLMESLGDAVVERFGCCSAEESTEVVRLKLAQGSDLADALGGLREFPGVLYAEPNQVFHLSDKDEPGRPDDLHPKLWALNNTANPSADIDALEAWKVTTGSRNGPLIAVIDSGADYRHPDLQANIAVNEGEIPGDGIDNDGNGVVDDYYGFNAFEVTGDPMDGMGHGTHVTGTIAAVGNNDEGMVGVNWQARVLPVKIFHDRGLTTTDAILRGLQYAKDRGATITSNSWGGPSFSQAIHDAFQDFPALHIAAAGNDSKNTDKHASYPANYNLPNIISVGATNRDDHPSWFTNTGRETVDLFAPGEEIFSTVPGNGYGEKSGTSMATPHVTGVAGLVASEFPQLGPLEMKDRLLYSTDPTESVSTLSVTGGRLNAARALSKDEIAPSVPNDFWVTQTSPTAARFSWTGTGDDGWKNGAATGFEVRVSDSPITPASWAHAEPLSTPRGGEIGDHHHAYYSQTPRSRESTVYAAFQALDEAGNRSGLATAQAVLPAAPILFQDNFDGESTQWSADGRWALREEEGRGKVWSSKFQGVENPTFSTLQSPLLDLRQANGGFLRFDSRQDFSWSNNVFVEISEDGDEQWTRLGELKDRGEWKEREYDLSAFDGKRVQVRLRSENLGSKEGDGMMVDRFEVVASTLNPQQ